jgi:uncharacterized membrane protein
LNKKIALRIAVLALIMLLAACSGEPGHDQESPPGRATDAGVPTVFFRAVTWVVIVLEAAGIFAILTGFIIGVFYFFQGTLRREKPVLVYRDLRERLGRAILLGLEFLVAADIVNTVAVEPTFRNLGVLAIVVLIRTFLSFAIEVEIHGRWPWQHKGCTEGGLEDQHEPRKGENEDVRNT